MSVDGSSPLDQAVRLCGELSSAHQIDLLISVLKGLKKEVGGGKGGSRKKVAASGEKKAKKPLSPGVAAWMAFVKHCKETSPERFEGVSKESEKLAIVKAIRAEDEDAYVSFADEFKASYAPSAPGSAAASEDEGSEAEEAPAPPPKAKKATGAGAASKEPAKKAAEPKPAAASPSASAAAGKDKAAALAALKAKAAAKKPAAAGGASSASSSPAPAAAPAKEKKEKKAVKKAAAEPPAEAAEEESMKKMEILGENYWLDVKTNGLYEVGDGDSWGSWVGYYQPGEEEPIRFTDAPEEE